MYRWRGDDDVHRLLDQQAFLELLAHWNNFQRRDVLLHTYTLYGFRVNKMNCELMLTYDTPAYMFNVHKNQRSR